jgi:hypothetical protein
MLIPPQLLRPMAGIMSARELFFPVVTPCCSTATEGICYVQHAWINLGQNVFGRISHCQDCMGYWEDTLIRGICAEIELSGQGRFARWLRHTLIHGLETCNYCVTRRLIFIGAIISDIISICETIV